MWLTIAAAPPAAGTEDALPRLHELLGRAADIEAQLVTAGIGGMAEALAIDQQMRAVLDGLSLADLEHARRTVTSLVGRLSDAVGRLDRLHQLKRALAARR